MALLNYSRNARADGRHPSAPEASRNPARLGRAPRVGLRKVYNCHYSTKLDRRGGIGRFAA